jgi:peptide/nickel transport system ATP-binding protein
VSTVAADPVISVQDLCIHLGSGEAVVDGIGFTVAPGEVLGLVGESGSGKTTTALALLGYTRPGVHITKGTVEIGGQSILGRTSGALRALRGTVVSYVPQDPGAALNPSMRIGDAILDVLRAHRSTNVDKDAWRGALARVDLALPGFERRYPHQLSGGQQQRVTIAMASVCEPPVAVLDEPTTGLDVVTQDRILSELKALRDERGMAMVYVSHDLAVVAEMADRILVMYAGRVVESGRTADVIERPRHPYTRGLVAAIPDLGHRGRLRGIPGVSLGVGNWPPGCSFAPRCQHAIADCGAAAPALDEVSVDHHVRCVRWHELPVDERGRAQPGPGGATAAGVATTSEAERNGGCTDHLLEVKDLVAAYRRSHTGRPAVAGVSFSIGAGQCVALVGQSGSGKTTIGRCVAGLHVPTSGTIMFDGVRVAGAAKQRPLETRRRIQIIFQNPFESLNPRHRVSASIARPLRGLRGLSQAEAAAEVESLLERVRLPKRLSQRYPAELSGGERQRVAIARALAAEPDLLVCDEITSALDVSVQAAVLELLTDLQRDLSLSMLFITHNLGVVAAIGDSVLVMDQGSLCEIGPVGEVLSVPSNDYTRRLIAAAPRLPDAALR